MIHVIREIYHCWLTRHGKRPTAGSRGDQPNLTGWGGDLARGKRDGERAGGVQFRELLLQLLRGGARFADVFVDGCIESIHMLLWVFCCGGAISSGVTRLRERWDGVVGRERLNGEWNQRVWRTRHSWDGEGGRWWLMCL